MKLPTVAYIFPTVVYWPLDRNYYIMNNNLLITSLGQNFIWASDWPAAIVSEKNEKFPFLGIILYFIIA